MQARTASRLHTAQTILAVQKPLALEGTWCVHTLISHDIYLDICLIPVCDVHWQIFAMFSVHITTV